MRLNLVYGTSVRGMEGQEIKRLSVVMTEEEARSNFGE